MADEQLREAEREEQRDREMREAFHRNLSEQVAMQEIQRQLAMQRSLDAAQYPAASMYFMYPQAAVAYNSSSSMRAQQSLDLSFRDEFFGRQLRYAEAQQASLAPHSFLSSQLRAQKALMQAGSANHMQAYSSSSIPESSGASTPHRAEAALTSRSFEPPSRSSHKGKKSKENKKKRPMEELNDRPSPKQAKPAVEVEPEAAAGAAKTRPNKIQRRYSWRELGLGQRTGTPAYNAHERARYERLGFLPPKPATALELAHKMDALRCQTVYLPVDSPLQAFVETTSLDPESLSAQSEASGEKPGNKVEGGGKVPGKKTLKKETKSKKKGKQEKDDTKTVALNPDTAPLLHHAMGRLYNTMCRQDADDYSTDRRKSNFWSVEDIQTKLAKFRQEILALDEREAKILKESRVMGTGTPAIWEEAHRLLGLVPPEGC